MGGKKSGRSGEDIGHRLDSGTNLAKQDADVDQNDHSKGLNELPHPSRVGGSGWGF